MRRGAWSLKLTGRFPSLCRWNCNIGSLLCFFFQLVKKDLFQDHVSNIFFTPRKKSDPKNLNTKYVLSARCVLGSFFFSPKNPQRTSLDLELEMPWFQIQGGLGLDPWSVSGVIIRWQHQRSPRKKWDGEKREPVGFLRAFFEICFFWVLGAVYNGLVFFFLKH